MPRLASDVVFAHAGDALQHQRLEDRGVEAAVGLGLAGELAVELGIVSFSRSRKARLWKES